jgi:hypothetical protein
MKIKKQMPGHLKEALYKALFVTTTARSQLAYTQ